MLTDWNATAPASRVVASLASPVTRIRMTLATDQPSVQFYSGNGLDGSVPRKADQARRGEDRRRTGVEQALVPCEPFFHAPIVDLQVYGPGPAFYEHWGTAVLEAQVGSWGDGRGGKEGRHASVLKCRGMQVGRGGMVPNGRWEEREKEGGRWVVGGLC